MKINFIGTGLFKSGGMKIIFEYANRLTENGHDVIFYYPIRQYNFGYNKLSNTIRRYYGNIKDLIFAKDEFIKFYNVKCRIKAVPIISNLFIRDSDIIMATQWPTAFDVFYLSNKKGKKFYFLQDYEIWESDIKKVNEALYLDLFKITISNYNKKFFKENFNINSYVILNGIDFNLYDIKEKDHLKESKIICFIEHHLDSTGVNNAIEVVKSLHKNYKNLEFISFGQQKYHDIPEYVKFYQNLNDEQVVKNIYGQTDIFIYPSLKEGFALPPAEAMSCKCAVVTTTVGAVPEYSINNKTAIHVPPNEPKLMYQAVVDLLENNKIKELAENAYIDIRKKLDWNNSVKKLEDVFTQSL